MYQVDKKNGVDVFVQSQSEKSIVWAVAVTQPGAADRAAINVARQGFNYYLPKFRVTHARRGKVIERERLLFPGYLFVEITDRWYSLMNTFGISRVLTNNGKPEAINPQIIEDLRSCEIGGYYKFPEPKEPFAPGQLLKSLNGLLEGKFCVYESMTAADRVRVLFSGVGFEFRTEMFTKDLEVA